MEAARQQQSSLLLVLYCLLSLLSTLAIVTLCSVGEQLLCFEMDTGQATGKMVTCEAFMSNGQLEKWCLAFSLLFYLMVNCIHYKLQLNTWDGRWTWSHSLLFALTSLKSLSLHREPSLVFLVQTAPVSACVHFICALCNIPRPDNGVTRVTRDARVTLSAAT